MSTISIENTDKNKYAEEEESKTNVGIKGFPRTKRKKGKVGGQIRVEERKETTIINNNSLNIHNENIPTLKKYCKQMMKVLYIYIYI